MVYDIYLVADGGALIIGPEDLADEGDMVRPSTEGGRQASLHALAQSPQDQLAIFDPMAFGQDLYLRGVQRFYVHGRVIS